MGIAASAHGAFSAFGFNITDEGFTLAYARRLLDGQVPHRDFIIIRPFLSPLMHVPILALDTQYTFWLARFVVWFECAIIAWLSTDFILRVLKFEAKLLIQSCLALISFIMCVHTFAIMPWHSFDGLLFSVCGIAILARRNPNLNSVGYFVLGLSYLAKQSFALMPIFAIFAFAEFRQWRYWLASASPGILYVLFLAVFGAIPDAWLQLATQHGIFDVGVLAYLRKDVVAGLFIGALIGANLTWSPEALPVRWRQLLRVISDIFILALIPWSVYLSYIGVIRHAAFELFGIVVGIAGCAVVSKEPDDFRRGALGLLLAATAWSVSISIGYNSPALGAGMMLSYVLCFAWLRSGNSGLLNYRIFVPVLALLLCGSFVHARHNYIYLDLSADRLTRSLDSIHRGASLILTNDNTADMLADLQVAISRTAERGKRYAVLPDLAGHWATSVQANPLPIDWPVEDELGRQELAKRVIQAIDNARDDQIIILQKYKGRPLATRLEHMPISDFRVVVGHVRKTMEKVDETKYFDLYR